LLNLNQMLATIKDPSPIRLRAPVVESIAVLLRIHTDLQGAVRWPFEKFIFGQKTVDGR
jgi:hypothetical protein